MTADELAVVRELVDSLNRFARETSYLRRTGDTRDSYSNFGRVECLLVVVCREIPAIFEHSVEPWHTVDTKPHDHTRNPD